MYMKVSNNNLKHISNKQLEKLTAQSAFLEILPLNHQSWSPH